MAISDDDGAGLAPLSALAAAPTRPPMGLAPATLATDADLLAAVARRDDRALAALYDRHGRTAYALARGILTEPGAAEGAVQDAFLAVWRGAAPALAGGGDARLWLLGQVRLRAIERSRGVSGLCDATRDGVAAVTPSGDPGRAGDALRHALAALPHAHSRALRLVYFGGPTCRELADREGVPVATVRARLRAGLAALRDSTASV